MESPQRSWCSDQAIGWMLWGLSSGRYMRFLYFSRCKDQLWSQPSLLLSRYQGLSWGTKMTTHPHLVDDKNECSYTSPSMCLGAIHRNFTFSYILLTVLSMNISFLTAWCCFQLLHTDFNFCMEQNGIFFEVWFTTGNWETQFRVSQLVHQRTANLYTPFIKTKPLFTTS